MFLLPPGLRLWKLLFPFLPLLFRFFGSWMSTRLKMKSSFIRLIESTREKVVCRLSHEDSPGHCVYYSVMSFNRVTADLSIVWDVNCPLSFVERLKAILWFVRFVSKL